MAASSSNGRTLPQLQAAITRVTGNMATLITQETAELAQPENDRERNAWKGVKFAHDTLGQIREELAEIGIQLGGSAGDFSGGSGSGGGGVVNEGAIPGGDPLIIEADNFNITVNGVEAPESTSVFFPDLGLMSQAQGGSGDTILLNLPGIASNNYNVYLAYGASAGGAEGSIRHSNSNNPSAISFRRAVDTQVLGALVLQNVEFMNGDDSLTIELQEGVQVNIARVYLVVA